MHTALTRSLNSFIGIIKTIFMEEERETLEHLDQAFQWLVLLLSLLVAAFFEFLTWVGDPEKELFLIAKFMSSLLLPLTFSILFWFWQVLTLNRERKMSLRLLAWGSSSIVFMYYCLVLLIISTLGLTAVSPQLVAVLVLLFVGVFSWIPYWRIIILYRAVTLDLRFWERSILLIWSPFIVGIFTAAILILAPLLFF